MATSPIKGSYVLFASRFAQDTYCAVPTSQPIPDFLVGAGWRFVRRLNSERPRQPGFKEKAAEEAIRRDGYYLFTAPPLQKRPKPITPAD